MTGAGAFVPQGEGLREIPNEERRVLMESTPELHVDRCNHVGYIGVRWHLGEAQVGAYDCCQPCCAYGQIESILHELRGIEAPAFLRSFR